MTKLRYSETETDNSEAYHNSLRHGKAGRHHMHPLHFAGFQPEVNSPQITDCYTLTFT
jgi:hypothetical protein